MERTKDESSLRSFEEERGTSEKFELKRVVTMNRKLVATKFVPLLVWYYSDIPKGKDMSAERHGDTEKRLCATLW